MGVMTSKDMEQRSKVAAGGSKDSPSASVETRTLVRCAVFPGAPKQGECNASFFGPEGETVTVRLKNQVYVFKDEEEQRSLLPFMLKAGFRKTDYFEGEAPKVEKKEIKFTVRYAHPDNEPDAPKQGNVAFTVGRGRGVRNVNFDLDEFGTVTTSDEQVQKKLESLGWAEIGKWETKDDE